MFTPAPWPAHIVRSRELWSDWEIEGWTKQIEWKRTTTTQKKTEDVKLSKKNKLQKKINFRVCVEKRRMESLIKVVKLKRKAEEEEGAINVYIGRKTRYMEGSPLGNPFNMHNDEALRDHVVDDYKKWLLSRKW